LSGSADSAQSYATLRDLVQKGDAQLDVLSAVVARSGQRAVLEELSEVIFPGSTAGPSVDVRASSPAARRPASFTSFETRNTGVTMEIEPVVDAEGFFVDLNIVPQIVQRNGMLELGDVAAKYPLQPLFTTRKITTTATTGLGIPLLLGTMSQPRDNGVNGRKDDERTSLAYVRVTPLRP
jgi:general secretion pathway protein D